MYYIVNKETKEHRVRRGVPPKGWYEVKADDQGWIEHDGGVCPLPHNAPVEVRRKDGAEFSRDHAHTLCWNPLDRDGYSIEAYRPSCYHEQEEEEWSGEGLPPVGTVCEGYVQDSSRSWDWHKVEILKQNSISSNECAVHVVSHSILRWCDQFRPIRTAEEVAVEAMAQACSDSPHKPVVHSIYTAIREGRIPGVKLEGK